MKNAGLKMVASEPRRTGLVFERLPRESVKAFTAFRTYLDLGAQRSLAAVATKLGKSKVLMERWSRRYDWSGRVAAHVGYVAQIERETIEALAREKAIEWHNVHEEQRIAEWQARGRLVKLANRLVDRWEKAEHRTGTPEGIARLFELASRLGRLASGMPTDFKEVKETLTGTLEIDWEIALRKVFGGEKTAELKPPAAAVDVEVLESTNEVKP